MHLFLNQIQKNIIEYININNGAFYGDMVKHFNYPATTVMRNLVELKKLGLVFKDNDGGQFKTI
jgi:predicted transcriptional regulator